MPCADHAIAATKKIWRLVLTQADGAPSTRVVITCAIQGLRFGQIKLKTRKGLTCKKEALSCHHSSCSCTRSLTRLTRTASLLSILQKTRWTVVSCDLKKVDMTAAHQRCTN